MKRILLPLAILAALCAIPMNRAGAQTPGLGIAGSRAMAVSRLDAPDSRTLGMGIGGLGLLLVYTRRRKTSF